MTITKNLTSTTRAPYQVGDHLSVLFGHPTNGTCLDRAARVLAVERTDERPQHPWTITYRISGLDQVHRARVNAAGVDASQYIEPSTSVLTIDEAHTDAGQIATALAATLRRAKVPGPLATTTGGSNVAVVVTWPSGNDRIVIGVEVWEGAPVFYVAAYEDREHEPPAHEHTAHSIPAAVTEVVRLLAPFGTNTAAATDEPAAPWAAPDGLRVNVHHTDGTTTTAAVLALIDCDDEKGTVRVESLSTETGEGIAIVRRTFSHQYKRRAALYAEPYTPGQSAAQWKYNGATITGHEPVTQITGPLRFHDHPHR